MNPFIIGAALIYAAAAVTETFSGRWWLGLVWLWYSIANLAILAAATK